MLIMLVSAFAGYQHTMNAYKTAVEQNIALAPGRDVYHHAQPQAISERS